MGWRIVHVKDGDILRLRLDNLEVRKQENSVHIPLSDVNMIVLEGNRTVVTTKLLMSLSQNNIGLVICDDKYLPVGLYLPYGQYHHMAKRVIWQASWMNELKDTIWQEIVTQKMMNQISFAAFKGAAPERLNLMTDLVKTIVAGDKTNREGHVAKVYFDTLYGKQFTRSDEVLENYAMNFGYAIIRSTMARIVVGNGLITMLGIFHRNEFNSFNLVDDLMEPFRPLMDYWIDRFVLNQNDYLSYEARLKIIDFVNETIVVDHKKMTIDNAMQEYVKTFITAMENHDPTLILSIELKNFVGE